MGVTKLERKDRKNKARAINKQVILKQLSWKPTIKKVDVEAIKKDFAEKKEKNNQ